nr:MAG TPA: hypothetical protein [Caudoviricetes sp.]
MSIKTAFCLFFLYCEAVRIFPGCAPLRNIVCSASGS